MQHTSRFVLGAAGTLQKPQPLPHLLSQGLELLHNLLLALRLRHTCHKLRGTVVCTAAFTSFLFFTKENTWITTKFCFPFS